MVAALIHYLKNPHWRKQHRWRSAIWRTMSRMGLTGLHALHMVIGLGIMSVITVMAWKNIFDEEYYTPVEVAGLYWHFVDIIWIFLFPLLYLVGGHFKGA